MHEKTAVSANSQPRTLVERLESAVGQRVRVEGWVAVRRDMGKIIFIHLRDRTGQVQVVFAPGECAQYETAKSLRDEYVIRIVGTVKERAEKNVNPDLATGKIELAAESLDVLGESATPPFPLGDTRSVDEELRLRHRYLDLRTSRLNGNLRLRHRVIKFIRDFLDREGFIEVETPMLTKGTPEGAREFVVPSRLHPGKFYVLPQSPQQFKQLLMVAGVERYFQIARCFRDEDQRGDRQPEFTQLDLEMSFVEQEDVLALNEKLMVELVSKVCPNKKISQVPFPRLTYAQAVKQHGSDKPDLRGDRQDPNELAFCWVLDFPMFERNDDGSLAAMHHPFCMPHPDDIEKIETDPTAVRAAAYDLVLNGFEISSGSIRIHDRGLQNRIFKALGLSAGEIQNKFGHMLEAFGYGAPPHGGMAPGLDRLIMILANEENIREVMAFPKTGDARDVMMGAPSEISARALREAHIQKRT